MQVYTSRFLTGFETLLLCSVIRPIVGVCSIQWEKRFIENILMKSNFPFLDTSPLEDISYELSGLYLLLKSLKGTYRRFCTCDKFLCPSTRDFHLSVNDFVKFIFKFQMLFCISTGTF